MKRTLATLLTVASITVHAQGIREPDGIRQSGGGQKNSYPQTCADIKARVKWLDDISRDPQSGYTQEWVKRERQEMINLDFRLQCK